MPAELWMLRDADGEWVEGIESEKKCPMYLVFFSEAEAISGLGWQLKGCTPVRVK